MKDDPEDLLCVGSHIENYVRAKRSKEQLNEGSASVLVHLLGIKAASIDVLTSTHTRMHLYIKLNNTSTAQSHKPSHVCVFGCVHVCMSDCAACGGSRNPAGFENAPKCMSCTTRLQPEIYLYTHKSRDIAKD